MPRLLPTFLALAASAAVLGAATPVSGAATGGTTFATSAKPAPPPTSYTALVEALADGRVRTAKIDDVRHVATVTFTDGQKASIRYPAADTTLPLRLARH